MAFAGFQQNKKQNTRKALNHPSQQYFQHHLHCADVHDLNCVGNPPTCNLRRGDGHGSSTTRFQQHLVFLTNLQPTTRGVVRRSPLPAPATSTFSYDKEWSLGKGGEEVVNDRHLRHGNQNWMHLKKKNSRAKKPATIQQPRRRHTVQSDQRAWRMQAPRCPREARTIEVGCSLSA